MSKKIITTGLTVVIMVQFAVLASEYLCAMYPLWTGQEISLKTIPVDPRSLFRGNYARLRYGISTIEGKDVSEKKDLRDGEVIYVKLKPSADGFHVFDGASLAKPETGPFIRGRIQGSHGERHSVMYEVRYGIEAYFAPKEKALALEEQLRDSALAIIMVAGNGKAALKEIIKNRNDTG
ncbi:MAG: GDYXXLXY domain-containing protein [Thermodesulfobacteriota bacterium]|nr:GDYXXLXY domain-containing protein [Thermodesulfobacteriota bacterium]